MWEHPSAVCMSLVAMLGELDLAWTEVMSLLRVNWQLLSWEEVGLETEWLESEPAMSWGFPSAPWLSPAYWRQEKVLSCWSRNLEAQVQAASVPFRCVLSPLPALALLPQRGAALEQEGLVRSLGVSGQGLWPSSWSQISGLLSDELLCKQQEWLPTAVLTCHFRPKRPLSVTAGPSPQPLPPPLQCEDGCPTEQAGLCGLSARVRTWTVVVQPQTETGLFWWASFFSTNSGCPYPSRWFFRSKPSLCITAGSRARLECSLSSGWLWNQPDTCTALSLLPLLCLGSEQVGIPSSWVEFRLPTALLLVPAVLQPAVGTYLPCVRPQGWDTQYCCSNHEHPREDCYSRDLPFPLSLLSRARVPTWFHVFSSFLIQCGSFLQACLYRSIFASLQLIFSQNHPHLDVFLMYLWVEVSFVSPCGSAGKESACNAGTWDQSLGRSPGEGKGYALQYSGLENTG